MHLWCTLEKWYDCKESSEFGSAAKNLTHKSSLCLAVFPSLALPDVLGELPESLATGLSLGIWELLPKLMWRTPWLGKAGLYGVSDYEVWLSPIWKKRTICSKRITAVAIWPAKKVTLGAGWVGVENNYFRNSPQLRTICLVTAQSYKDTEKGDLHPVLTLKNIIAPP